MLSYAGGDYSAFEQLYQRHRLPLMRYLKRRLGDLTLAEEVFQEIWLKVINARQEYRALALFKTYLYKIARNALIDYYRKDDSQPQFDHQQNTLASVSDPIADPERSLCAQNQLKVLLELIEKLPVEQGESFLLKEEAGLSIEEIAQVTGTSVEAAKSRVRYAMQKLRSGLEAIYGRI